MIDKDMKTQSSDARSLQIKRIINAPRDRVYAAWSDPAQLKQWFGPEAVETDELIADVRPGGEFRWSLTNSDGEKMTARGEYREVVPGSKVSFTWQWDDDEDWADRTSLVTVEFSDVNGGTEVRLTHEQLPSPESAGRHTEGWTDVLRKLEKFLGR